MRLPSILRRPAARLPGELRDHWPPGALLVGGAARDLLRGRGPRDYDWLVPDPQAAAEDWAGAEGSVFPLDRERGHWRVLRGGVQHDFAPLPGGSSLEAELGRRDFTVNALALRQDGRVTDPFGGRADLRRRRVRMVSEANLRADPLRLLRAARLSVTLGFGLEARTREAVRRLAAAGLPLPAAERVRDELDLLLGAQGAAEGILLLERLGLLALYLPELREGVGVVQGGFHHLDVFRHGVEALHQLLARRPDAALALRWAALLHDVGKPGARGLTGDGRVNFRGHDKLGAELAAQVLTRLREPSGLVSRVSALVGAHMLPLPASEREARRFVHRRGALLPDLLWVMLADREAARGPDSSPASRLSYQRGFERVLAAQEALEQVPPAPLLDGGEVMRLLHLPPGPPVGAALSALAEARALGDVRTVEEGRAWLRQWAAGRKPGSGT